MFISKETDKKITFFKIMEKHKNRKHDKRQVFVKKQDHLRVLVKKHENSRVFLKVQCERTWHIEKEDED